MFKTVLIAVDGSQHSLRALDTASGLVKLCPNARLIVVSVFRHMSLIQSSHSLVGGRQPLEKPDAALARLAGECVDEAVARAREQGVSDILGLVRRGPIARTIVQVANEQGADVIVMGSRGTGEVESLLLGSVSHKVCTIAERTCIIVR